DVHQVNASGTTNAAEAWRFHLRDRSCQPRAAAHVCAMEPLRAEQVGGVQFAARLRLDATFAVVCGRAKCVSFPMNVAFPVNRWVRRCPTAKASRRRSFAVQSWSPLR